MKSVITFLFINLFVFFGMIEITQAEIFFQDDFESANLLHPLVADNSSWGGSSADASGGDSVGVSGEFARSGAYALRFFFNGNTDLNDDAWAEQRYIIGSGGRPEFYLSYWAYFSSNYIVRDTPSSDNNKIGTTWADEYSVDGRYNIEIGGVGANINIRTRRDKVWPHTNATCSDSGGILAAGPNQPYWSGLYDTRGKWTHWEFHFKMDDGTGNGASQLWIDGELVISETNIAHIGAPCQPFYIKNGYLMGWANSGFNEDTTVYIDEVKFSDEYIGLDNVNDVVLPAAPIGLSVM